MFDAQTLNIILNIATLLLGGGMLGVVLRHRHGMRSLQNADDADVRDHYSEELQRVVVRQRACEQREELLRQRVVELENDILGLISIIRQASADKVLVLDSRASNIIKDMAERIDAQRKL
jgi:Tfp pilus assembly protein PilV